MFASLFVVTFYSSGEMPKNSRLEMITTIITKTGIPVNCSPIYKIKFGNAIPCSVDECLFE